MLDSVSWTKASYVPGYIKGYQKIKMQFYHIVVAVNTNPDFRMFFVWESNKSVLLGESQMLFGDVVYLENLKN